MSAYHSPHRVSSWQWWAVGARSSPTAGEGKQVRATSSRSCKEVAADCTEFAGMEISAHPLGLQGFQQAPQGVALARGPLCHAQLSHFHLQGCPADSQRSRGLLRAGSQPVRMPARQSRAKHCFAEGLLCRSGADSGSGSQGLTVKGMSK